MEARQGTVLLLYVIHEDEIKSQLHTHHELLIQQGQKQK